MYEKNVQQNNYNIKLIPFQLKLPIDLDKKIDMDSSLRTLLKITKRCDITVYEAEGDCNDCPLKSLCTIAKGNRKIHVSKDFLELRNEFLSRITSSDGIILDLIVPFK